MKKIVISSVVAGLLASSLSSANIVAVKVHHSLKNIPAMSPLWKEAKAVNVGLFPQTTVKMNDKKANEMNAENSGKTAKVKALYNDSEVAFLIRWKDNSLSVQKGYKTNSYADGFAVQFAKDFSNPAELPYIGMGSEGREVLVHLQKAAPKISEPNGHGNVELQTSFHQTNYFGAELEKFKTAQKEAEVTDYERTFVSAGFRSMTEIKDGSVNSDMNMLYNIKRGCWHGTLNRELSDEYLKLDSAFPVAFAIWDGGKNNRDGLKLLSGWNSVSFAGKDGGEALVSELNDDVAGDVVNGKAQYEMNCAACHLTKDIQMTIPFMAPELSNIGGYGSTAYIKESIVNPNAVIVPGYNRNAHKNTPWYNVVDGKRVSTMPSFSWLDEKSLTDIVAYVKTLKTEGK